MNTEFSNFTDCLFCTHALQNQMFICSLFKCHSERISYAFKQRCDTSSHFVFHQESKTRMESNAYPPTLSPELAAFSVHVPQDRTPVNSHTLTLTPQPSSIPSHTYSSKALPQDFPPQYKLLSTQDHVQN